MPVQSNNSIYKHSNTTDQSNVTIKHPHPKLSNSKIKSTEISSPTTKVKPATTVYKKAATGIKK